MKTVHQETEQKSEDEVQSATVVSEPIDEDTPDEIKIISSTKVIPAAQETEVVLRGDLSSENRLVSYIPAESGCKVYAAESGECVCYTMIQNYGACVGLKLNNGNFAYYVSMMPYTGVAKLGSVDVKVGETVSAGQLIGYAYAYNDSSSFAYTENLGSGAGYIYTALNPSEMGLSAYDSLIGENGYIDPLIAQSYLDRGYKLNDNCMAILSDYNSFKAENPGGDWHESESYCKWFDTDRAEN